MRKIIANDRLYDVVGLIPATGKTPDIYYCGDPSSEKVAALAFLTMWFFDPAIQSQLKERASGVICGLSPSCGGRKLEKAFSESSGFSNFGGAVETFDIGTQTTEYSGTCHYPEWKGDTVLRQGYIAVYATSSNDDERNGYTIRWKEKCETDFSREVVAAEDHKYQSIYTPRENSFGIQTILAAFLLPEKERDERLAEILKSEFSDIHTLYDFVPKRTAHEVSHLLEHGNDLIPTSEMIEEVRENISLRNPRLRHYAQPLEAVAELAGIVLLNQVRRNAGLDFGIPTTMLDKILPNAFDHVERKINFISGTPEPR